MCSWLFRVFLVLFCCTVVQSTQDVDLLKSIFGNRTFLAFGDGLTKGYLGLSRRNVSRSYAVQLNRFLNKSSIPLYLSAKNSETTAAAAIRLPKVLSLTNQKRVKMVIIMSGTTDLILNYTSTDILSNLITMHKAVHNLSVDPIFSIVVAIPHVRTDNGKEMETTRQEVNLGLMKYALTCPHLAQYSNFDKELNRSMETLWAVDGIHLSEKGYDELGIAKSDELLKVFEKRFRDASILTFGDSLTHGLVVDESPVPGGPRPRSSHPYSIQLQKEVNKSSVSVIESGINGEHTHSMIHRLSKVLSDNRNVKLAVILGGTNDLGRRDDADTILGNLIRMHELAHNSSLGNPVLTIALGIPQLKWHVNQTARVEVNQGLQDYAKRCSHLVHYRDFEDRFNQSVPENKKYWSVDFVHFSVVGYDEIGRVLYEDILQFVHRLSNHKTDSTIFC